MAETIGQVRSRNKKIITKRNEKETDLIIIPSEYCSACFQYSWPSSLSLFLSYFLRVIFFLIPPTIYFSQFSSKIWSDEWKPILNAEQGNCEYLDPF